MYKKHKWISGLRNFGAFNQLRQICDLTACFETLFLCQNANLAQCKLAGKSFEITYVSYTQRYLQAKNNNEKNNYRTSINFDN
jgi:hypothetical protein